MTFSMYVAYGMQMCIIIALALIPFISVRKLGQKVKKNGIVTTFDIQCLFFVGFCAVFVFFFHRIPLENTFWDCVNCFNVAFGDIRGQKRPTPKIATFFYFKSDFGKLFFNIYTFFTTKSIYDNGFSYCQPFRIKRGSKGPKLVLL